VLYIHSEFFGGEGFQAAMGWQDGRVFFGPAFTSTRGAEDPPYERVPAAYMAINAGLRALGLVPVPGQDECSTAGLEQHRWSDKSIAE
jgi:hypothetical protein